MNRAAPAALLLALVPTLARAGDLEEVVTPIVVTGIVFGFSALMIAIVGFTRHRNQRLRHETIRLALEKGQPLPPDLLDARPRRDPAFRDLRRGLVLLAVGLGIGLFLFVSPPTGGPERTWAVGFVPGLMGVSFLAAHWLAQRRDGAARPGRE